MNNKRNLQIYQYWSSFYDLVFNPIFRRERQKAIAQLELDAGQCLLVPGIGTGLDIPFLPDDVAVVGIDLSEAMLAKARQKVGERDITLQAMDAQSLEFPDVHFDAVLLNLVLSVVPDGRAALAEAMRVLRPGGQIIIFDKFLPEEANISGGRALLGPLIRVFGTDPNRKFSEMIAGLDGLNIKENAPSLLRGQYRIIDVRKAD